MSPMRHMISTTSFGTHNAHLLTPMMTRSWMPQRHHQNRCPTTSYGYMTYCSDITHLRRHYMHGGGTCCAATSSSSAPLPQHCSHRRPWSSRHAIEPQPSKLQGEDGSHTTTT